MDRRTSLIARIKAKCLVEDTGHSSPCWVWQGGHSGSGRGGGYGRISVDGQTAATHIVMFTCVHGYLSGNKQVDHLCNQTMCCNPDHLEAVSAAMNQKRKYQRANVCLSQNSLLS